MAIPHEIRTRSVIERKRPELPRFVVLDREALAGWSLEGTTVVEVTLGGSRIGRRTLKRWPERDGWFFDLTDRQSREAGVAVGDEVAMVIRLADSSPPEELERLISADEAARAAWETFTPAARRQLSEHVRAAKRPETRVRRARRGLGL